MRIAEQAEAKLLGKSPGSASCSQLPCDRNRAVENRLHGDFGLPASLSPGGVLSARFFAGNLLHAVLGNLLFGCASGFASG